jgi:hypothetical protein
MILIRLERCQHRRTSFDRIFAAPLGVILGILVLGIPQASSSYDYPIADPYLATVIGSLNADNAPVSEKIPKAMRLPKRFPERQISKVFWDQDEFQYSVFSQKKSAPLIFIVAGTGASYRSSKMLYLGRLFYDEGFHVVSLSSPTHPNFILTASSSGHPGFTPRDSEDLYAVMKEAYSKLASKVEISDVYLTGYSLGATQSAFLTAIDDRERAFEFKKVLMINPSVDLLASVQVLDDLFDYALPDGSEGVIDLIQRLLAEVSAYSNENGRRSVDSELLYKIAEIRIAEGRTPEKKALAGLIAAAFRISSANMLFTTDVLAGSGHIVEKGTELTVATRLKPYFRRGMTWPFERYFEEMLLPYWQSKVAGLDRKSFIEQASLRSLKDMLSKDPRIAVVTNSDDIILTEGDLDFLRSTMGERIHVYPTGGHCGNLSYRENAEYMVRYFKESRP